MTANQMGPTDRAMSAMLRASKVGARAGQPSVRRTSSSPGALGSGEESSDEQTGARLSDSSLSSIDDATPPRNNDTEANVVSRIAQKASSEAGFEVGTKPDDDVFSTAEYSYAPRSSVNNEVDTGEHYSPLRTAPQYAYSSSINPELAVDAAASTMVLATPSVPRVVGRVPSRHALAAPSGSTGPVDAQGIYPATACVFVANLPEPRDDLALEAAVTRAFSQFGTVFVKIRRDSNNMPFAFAQFTTEKDARTALTDGKGLMILGRPCRTEMVRANRTFVVYRRNGADITVDEVRSTFGHYGRFEKMEMLEEQLRENLNIPQAVLIEFSGFNRNYDFNDAPREYPAFSIDFFDAKKATGSRANADREFLETYDKTRRSLFINNMPLDVGQAELEAIFSELDTVKEVEVVKRNDPNGRLQRVFAFVEYRDVEARDRALDRLHGYILRDHAIKVVPRILKGAGPRRVASMADLSSAYQLSGPSNYNRGSQHGRPNVTPHRRPAGAARTPHAPSPIYVPAARVMNPAVGREGLPSTGPLQAAQSFSTPGRGAMTGPATPYTNRGVNPYGYPGGMWNGVYRDPATGTFWMGPPEYSPDLAAPSPFHSPPPRSGSRHVGNIASYSIPPPTPRPSHAVLVHDYAGGASLNSSPYRGPSGTPSRRHRRHDSTAGPRRYGHN
ncbi:hypothetical protein QBC35DRAFT_546712 [Podospora australis]|uniref:RRM domain-containing protein n=1 Tax=Podospora australis TaxID=1536484 RepID=A0AAN7AHU5_9PEZI|nr:hypothetical protein QBC35DRAFT_546712 [Podospora australis]